MGGSDRGARTWVPRWWAGEGGGWGALADPFLWPAEQAYRAAVALRGSAYDRGMLPVTRAPIPVVSVGNLGVGGAGKTPVAAWIAGRLLAWGLRPAVILRGYGADEILVHRELNPDAPVFAAKRRIDAVRRAAGEGCGVAVLDDAFQHRSLARDLDAVLVAAESGRFRRHLLPRGPWRERRSALRRADLVIVTRKSASGEEAAGMAAELRGAAGGPVVICHLAPSGLEPLHPVGTGRRDPGELKGRAVLAVASLADPRPLAEQLGALGADVELARYPDHHEFDAADVDSILRRAAGRTIILTRKEAVKLRPLMPPSPSTLVLSQEVDFAADEPVVLRLLREAAGR